jgi:hypothetical protein
MMLTLGTLPACSDSDDVIEEEEPISPINVETTATIVTDAATLSQRVTNYRVPQTRATVITGAKLPTFEMPRQPQIPTNAVALEDIIDARNDYAYPVDGGVYYVAEGTSVSYTGILLRNCDIYIAGTLNTGLGWRSSDDIKCRIFILPTGVLNLDNSIPTYASVYNYGTLHEVGKQDILEVNGLLYSIHDMDLTDTRVYVRQYGTMYVDGALISGDNRVQTGGTLYVGCESKFKSLYCSDEGTTFCLRGSLELTNDNFCTDLSSRAILASGSSIKAATKIEFLTPDVPNIEIDGDNYVFLEAPKLYSISTDMRAILPGRFALKFDEYWKVNKTDEGKVESYTHTLDLTDFQLYGSTIATEEDLTESTLTWPEGCEALLNTKPIYKLEQIASVAVEKELAGNISATCIAQSNGKIYVSWHQRGAGYQGRIEVGEVTSEGCTLLQALTTEASAAKENGGRDYNHIMVDPVDSRLYAVGNENKGGFIAYNDLDANGLIANNELKYRRLWGGDGNAIIRMGDYLQVASTYGLEVYTAADLTRVKRTELPGRAKYIASDASRVVTLGFETNDTTNTSFVDKDQVSISQTTAVLNQFERIDYLLESPTELQTGIVIAPVDGKNVIALDGDDIYVACGAAGIVRYGANPASFAIPTASDNHVKGYANGLAVDDQYVYVAYGAAGVYVLDKETLSVVTHYSNVGGKSANFVLVQDGKIYVAYGENGWEVLELVTI